MWFKKLGTFAFESGFIRQMVFFGTFFVDSNGIVVRDLTDKSNFCLAIWFNFIPEPFKVVAEGVALDIAHNQMGFMVVGDEAIEFFISKFHEKMSEHYEKKFLDRDGWRSE